MVSKQFPDVTKYRFDVISSLTETLTLIKQLLVAYRVVIFRSSAIVGLHAITLSDINQYTGPQNLNGLKIPIYFYQCTAAVKFDNYLW